MKIRKNSQNSTWISIIMVREYMDKVHMGHMCMWVLKCMFHMVCFTFGIHWITYFYIWRYFMQFSWDHDLGQVTSGFAHLTHGLSYELNGQSHWLFGPGRGS